MDKTQNYVTDSLEQHLFFARIMKEHALFLKAGFMPPACEFSQRSGQLMQKFEALLSRTASLADCAVRCKVLSSGETVTEFTDCAERKTACLTGIDIDRGITARTMKLKGYGGGFNVTPALKNSVRQLNREALQALDCLIAFKEEVLKNVSSCTMFTPNYPLLIEHILREARLYRSHLLRLEGMGTSGCQELRDSELFWNRIMMEHALFIRGLLDPAENELVDTANGFAKDYKRLLEASRNANDKMIQSAGSFELTKKFRDFKTAGVEGIEACKIRSVILPLLADHVLREANHYIRLMEA